MVRPKKKGFMGLVGFLQPLAAIAIFLASSFCNGVNVEVDGFVGIEDRRLGEFLEDNTEFDAVRAVGAYAKPLNLEI